MRLKAFLVGSGIGAWLLMGTFLVLGINRYPVGQPVPASVYTELFDPCDSAYKFLQAPPKDWTDQFGNNERTMLIHAVSELRVVVAAQGKRLMDLEKWQKAQPVWEIEPNCPRYGLYKNGTIYPILDPNEK